MARYSAIALVGLLLGCQEKAKLSEGVYTMAQEVAKYSGETIELKDGKFRYWFYSDFKAPDEPTYPLTGTYRISGNYLSLDHAQIHSPIRAIGIVNGVSVLWRNDGFSLWNKEKRIQPYAVLLRVEGATDGSKINKRPSLELLKPQAEPAARHQ